MLSKNDAYIMLFFLLLHEETSGLESGNGVHS